MARRSYLYITMVALYIITSGSLIKTGLAAVPKANNKPGQAPKVPIEIDEIEKENPFLRSCIQKIRYTKCGSTVFDYVHSEKVTGKCCRSLVTMGRPCHDALIKYLLTKQRFVDDLFKYYSEETFQTIAKRDTFRKT
ncbi:hypothetical protein RJ639_042040 [Escallonia herrerae]|uniref:Prolamin-like domain-containing protein n=1 Tax=Escallonia herrerae TaxID=1293975 RepID=A0AA88WPE2_9ASTE|nr:hypothetical protein RJ639_042040 [Escallonia herrerae]